MSQEELTYEYLEVVNDSSLIPLLMDGYESFGWEITKQTQLMQEEKNGKHLSNEKLGLRRNRHILNKMELTRLQRNFESCVVELVKMEKNKKRKGRTTAISMTIIGCTLVAISVFFITMSIHIVASTVIGLIGIIMWILSIPVYRKIVESETKRINSLIDQKYEEIYIICAKGKKIQGL